MRRAVLAACFAVLLLEAPAAQAHPICHGKTTCPELVAARHCEQGIVKSCIRRAAIHRRVDYQHMLSIAYRESRFDPGAKNPQSTASGLFQFLYPSTWCGTPYCARSPFSAKWNALAAAWLMSRPGGFGHWALTA